MPPFTGDIRARVPRLSKMDCSDTTQRLQVVLGKQFKMLRWGLECRSRTERTAFSHVLTKEAPLMQPRILGDLSKRTQTRSGSGVGFNFVDGRSRIFLLEGGWWVSRTHIPDQARLLPMNAVRRLGYAKQHPQRMVQCFSKSVINSKQASNIWSLYTFEGFLLHIRDIVKIKKVTNIN